MGAGTRENQFKKRFGQGKPIDTYGIQCIHAKPISPGTKATEPKVPFDWAKAKILEDASVAEKISSELWVRLFVKEIMDYGKLDRIGTGETEIQGLKIDIEKGIVQEGYSDSYGKSYFNLKVVDTGTIIRIYEDNTMSVFYKGKFCRLIEPPETEIGKDLTKIKVKGVDLTTILMRDYLEKIGFLDKFVIGQEKEVFGVKGIVKDKGVSNDGPYVTIEYKADTGRGSGVKEVRITANGATVNKRSIVGVKTDEDGAVYLLYKKGDWVYGALIKVPAISVKSLASEVEVVASKVDLGRALENLTFKVKFEAIKGEIGIQSPQDFTDVTAYAMQGNTGEGFRRTYGKEVWGNLRDYANDLSNSIVKEELERQGLKDIESKINYGAESGHPKGPDIIVSTKDGVKLKVDIEFAGSGNDRYSKQVNALMRKFAKEEADVGIIFWEGEYHIFVNPNTEYTPLRDIAQEAAQRGSRSIRDFAGVTTYNPDKTGGKKGKFV